MFRNMIFLHEKVKVEKKYLLLFEFYHFSFYFLFFQRISSALYYAKQFLGGFHLFDFFSFLRRVLSSNNSF